MNKRRKHVDRLLEIARSSRVWLKDFVDIGTMSAEQLEQVNESIERLEEYRRKHGLDYSGVRLARRPARQAAGAAQAAPGRLEAAAAVGLPTSASSASTLELDKLQAPPRGTALLTGTPNRYP